MIRNGVQNLKHDNFKTMQKCQNVKSQKFSKTPLECQLRYKQTVGVIKGWH